MRYINVLIAVADMPQAKKFYHDVLGLEVVDDFGANVTLTGGIFLQTADSWKEFIHKDAEEIIFGNNATELYFEEDDMDEFYDRLKQMPDIEFIHDLVEHSWGQRAVKFYDCDRHIIEVAENISSVVKRFIAEGMTPEETAVRMDVPLGYVLSRMN